MGKVSFVFSGQGAQAPGMGKALYEGSAGARAVFDMAERLRPGTIRQCFEGSAEELSITKNTQPCLFCVDLAAARALEEAGISPDFVAGFSLGEIAALTFAGVFTEEEGFSFVCKRAEAMQEAAEKNPGAMAAVLKLSTEAVEGLCKEFKEVWPVNFNCPGQIAVAGNQGEMAEFCKRVAESGGKAVPLAVSGGFHSPFMESAARALGEALAPMELKAPRIPVYANFTAAPYGENAKELVERQVKSPVRWEETINALWQEDCRTYLECGAGKTLCGLVRKTKKEAKTMNVETMEAVQAALALVKETEALE